MKQELLDKMNKQQILLQEMKERYERVFGSDDGKQVLDDIAKSGGMTRSCFSNDALQMAYMQGKRDLAMLIVDAARKDEVKIPKQTQGVKQ